MSAVWVAFWCGVILGGIMCGGLIAFFIMLRS